MDKLRAFQFESDEDLDRSPEVEQGKYYLQSGILRENYHSIPTENLRAAIGQFLRYRP